MRVPRRAADRFRPRPGPGHDGPPDVPDRPGARARSAVPTATAGPVCSRGDRAAGRPALPDTVKRDGQFNPEDFETIQKLQEALGELPGYKFDYRRQPRVADDRPARRTRRSSCSTCATRASTTTPSRNCTCRPCWRCWASPTAARARPAWACATTNRWCGPSPQSLDIPVPLETYFNPDDQSATLPSVFPALVKPNYGDSQHRHHQGRGGPHARGADRLPGRLRERAAGPARC